MTPEGTDPVDDPGTSALQQPQGSPATRLLGRVKRWLGWFTADRDVEAKGKAEAQLGRPPRPAAVRKAAEQVKDQYGETPDR